MARPVPTTLDFVNAGTVTNLIAPSAPNDAVRLLDLQQAIEGLSWKDEARVSTQGNISLASPGATIDGVAMALNDRFLVRSQTTQSENGIYIWNGGAVPATRSLDASTGLELRQATVTVAQGTDAGNSFRQTATVTTIGTDSVTWASFGSSAPAASTTTAGIIELATQAEVDAGTASNLGITPSTLASHSGRKFKASLVIGDGTATQFDLTHNFNTRDIQIVVYRNATPWDSVIVDEERPTLNAARVRFNTAPAANAYVMMVLG